MNRTGAALAVLLLVGCATTVVQPKSSEPMNGTASWYGQEFAGRTTANGEIFDPMQLTAAHRTLPFGTVLDVRNASSGQVVRVRVNDRGPYINDRVIDLSYAAALQIGLIEPGSGPVELVVVKVGRGDREPPAPYVVTVPEVKPLPPAGEPPGSIPVVVDVVETRKQVSPDGKKVINIPTKPNTASAISAGRYVVQVGAFAQETNAKLLQDQLFHIGEKSYIEHVQLYRVRIGPFITRDEAIRMRTRLETAGLSAIVVMQ